MYKKHDLQNFDKIKVEKSCSPNRYSGSQFLKVTLGLLKVAHPVKKSRDPKASAKVYLIQFVNTRIKTFKVAIHLG